MMHAQRSKEPLLTASTTVDIRWFYSTITFLFALVTLSDPASSPSSHLYLLFGGHLFANLVVHLLLEDISRMHRSGRRLLFINVFQVVLDFAYLTLMLYVAGSGFLPVAQILYVIPIVLALIYFRLPTTLAVALSSAISIFLLAPGASSAEVAVVSGIYIFATLFGRGIVRSITHRHHLLMTKMDKEEDHIRRLNLLAKEFDASAKLLVRRDLDLLKAHQELERIDEMKSEIVSVVAHQLRTPLSAVKWTLKMLSDGDSGPISTEQKTMMMKAYESNERMIGLVNDMLSADRMESGKFHYRFFPIQLEDLIENVMVEILPKANERGVTVHFLRPKENLPRVSIDPDKIREVLQNLIDNAVKYSRRGGVVTIAMHVEEKMLLCSVADQGIGIPRSEQGKIFERFFRAQNALRVETDGSGLGLFIVRGIIQRHGGTVSFESQEGKGTTMCIRLPLGLLPRTRS